MRVSKFLHIALSCLVLNGAISCREDGTKAEPDEKETSGLPDHVADSASPSGFKEPTFDPEDEMFGLIEPWSGDLDEMIERGRIRALVPYNRTYYYIDGRHRRGIAYEALRLFEKDLNEQLGKKPGRPGYVQVVFIPVTRDQLLPFLQEGYGDLVVANLTITEARQKVVEFSVPSFTEVREIIVSGPASPPISGLADLIGDTVYLRPSSSYFEHLSGVNDSLRAQGKPAINVSAVDENLEDDEILELVNTGLIPVTIVDEHIADLWAQVLDRITLHKEIAIASNGEIAWAFRKHSPELQGVVDAFIQKNKVGTLTGNILVNRYLRNLTHVKRAMSPEAHRHMIELRELFVRYGSQYNLDWMLLAAQGYQESELDNSRRSPAGAVGVMQIKPSTAADPNVGISDVYNLENNIHAAAKYLDFIRSRYYSDPSIDSLDAVLFSLAAYNMGPSRMNRVRRKAGAQGVDPNTWFGQVELLVAREVGREPVQYVSNIFNYYTSFRSLRRYGLKTGKSLE